MQKMSKTTVLELPINLEDKIYVVPSKTNYLLNIVNRHPELNKIREFTIHEIHYNKHGYSVISYIDYTPFCFYYKSENVAHHNIEEFYQETWFVNREEAKKKLNELSEQAKEVFGR